MDRIADAARVNKQLLFHYFGSKAGLYAAASESASKRYDVGSLGGVTLAERLRSLADRLLAAGLDGWRLLSLDWRARAHAQARRVITDGQRQGFVRDDIDPAPLSELLVTACLGWASTVGDDRRGREARDHFRDTIVAVLSDYCAWR